MREAYQSDLVNLVDDLVDLAGLARTALDDATTALLESDIALAERVIAADANVDERQSELDAKVVELLARQSPVATDLRLLVASLRISSSLERMGDLAAHIALVARRRHPVVAVPESLRDHVRKMAELASTAAADAASVIRTRDLALAASVENGDEKLDDMLQDIIRSISRENDYTQDEVVDLTLLGRFYERFGDHAVSIVRRVGFLVTGEALDTEHATTDVVEF